MESKSPPKKYPPTYIRSVAIGLPDEFNFDNLPHPHDTKKKETSKPFIGRDELITKFKKMLESGKGVYLVTGFRGMGKTSFVNKVISEYNASKKRFFTPLFNKYKLHKILITLAQSKPTEVDVLRMMVSSLQNESNKLLKWWLIGRKVANFSWKLGIIFSLALIFLFLIDGTNFHNDEFYKDLGKDSWGNYIFNERKIKLKVLSWLIYSMIVTLLGFAYHVLNNEFVPYITLWKRLDDLYKRSHATTSFENNESGELSLEMINAKLLQAGGKKTESYPIASAKEIEHELSSIINVFKKANITFVFVFDELDKVEQGGASKEDNSPIFYSLQGADRANIDHLRERRHIIQQIIAGLKNFFTTTEVPFILIAGREMFEASMADISDRQSSVSSIFSYVFYIKSLLSEKIEGSNALSKGIENLLYQLIYPTNQNNTEQNLYYIDINSYNVGTSKTTTKEHLPQIQENVKINMLFQNFIVYLTYRSNGSPKKLIKLIHEFVYVHTDDGKTSQLKNAIVWKTPNNFESTTFYSKLKNIIHLWKNDNQSFKGSYILFDYAQQQRIGFLGYMYRPFLVKYGSSFKQYSDNMVVSTSFLFDHLLKFHPFAFSNSHLELIPEVLSTNRTPALRDHIKKIIDYLTLNHIRETEIGLFEYKFYNKTVNEIYYLSKTFEEESAAFNFTLDESYLIKLHVISKLKDLRSSHANEQGQGASLFSLAYLNGILGDLHFFDQEYDDAIAAYSDVLSTMPRLDISSNRTMQDFILILKYKLKLGLTFEKVKSFEEALSLYSDAVLDTQRFIEEALKPTPKFNDKINLLSSSLSDIMQIANQAFLANIVLQEKMGVEGITAKKSSINIGGFLNLITNISKKGGFNSTILSNLYLQIGTLLYLKNSILAFEWNLEDKGHYQLIFNNFMPSKYREHIDNIKEANKHYSEIDNTYRLPLMAMNMYCLGLKYLLETRIHKFELKFEEKYKTLNNIAQKFKPATFNEYFNSLGKIHFRYIAIYLSNIGDCMLSMMKYEKQLGGFRLSDMYNTTPYKNNNTGQNLNNEKGNSVEEVFERFYAHDDNFIELPYKAYENFSLLILPKNITPKKVILYYFLSAYYFEKCSRIRSQSFQLRKILYVLRLAIGEKFDKNNPETDNFLEFIETHVVNETLKIASRNAEYSDVHDYNKYIGFWNDLKEEEKKNTLSQKLESLDSDVQHKIRFNLSNSPDIREPLLLFGHIKLKVIDIEIVIEKEIVKEIKKEIEKEIKKEIEKKIKKEIEKKRKTDEIKKIIKEQYYKASYKTFYEKYYKMFYEKYYKTFYEKYDNLVGEHYGISTQYLRLIELTFAVKLHESKIKLKKKQYTLDGEIELIKDITRLEELKEEEKKKVLDNNEIVEKNNLIKKDSEKELKNLKELKHIAKLIEDGNTLKDILIENVNKIELIKDKIRLKRLKGKKRELTIKQIKEKENLIEKIGKIELIIYKTRLEELNEEKKKRELTINEIKEIEKIKGIENLIEEIKKRELIKNNIRLKILIKKEENKTVLTDNEKREKENLIEKEKKRELIKEEEELKEICINMLHSLTQIIQIIEVYDNDYLVGHSFMAYYYLKLAELFDFNEEGGNNKTQLNKKVVEAAKKDFLEKYSIEKKAYAIFDCNYTYGMAAILYDKALKLHSAGDDYKKAISDTHYLEDDLNDSSYHFGAAMDRYLMINDVLSIHMKKAKDKITKNKGYKFESY